MKEDVYNYYNLIKNSHVLVRPDILFQGNKDEEWIEYKPEIHGYLAFGYICPRAYFNSWFIKISDNFILRSKVSNFHEGNGDKISDEASKIVDVRIGGHHEADYSDFIQSVPADGSNAYKVYFCL